MAYDPRRWWALAVLCLALCAIVIDNTILNVFHYQEELCFALALCADR